MIVRRLVLGRFQGIPDGEFEFAPGINVIVGPNEAGKSTLRRALRMALYASPATTSQKIREFRTWGMDEAPEIQLEFEIDGKRFLLTKDFANRKVLLAGNGRTWESLKTVQESLVAALGLQTEQLFEATAQVAQAELERVQLTSIAKELSRIVGGGGEDAATALKRLEQRLREMEKGSRGMAKDPGILVSLEGRAASLKAQHEKLIAGAAEEERRQRELTEVNRRLEETRQQLDTKRALLETNRKILQREQELEIRKSQAAMLDERVKKIEGTLSTLAELTRELEAATASGMPDEQLVRVARTTVERIRMRELEVEKLRHSLGEPLPPISTNAAPWKSLLVAGSVVGLVGIGLLAATSTVVGLLFVVVGIIAGGLGLWKVREAGASQRVIESLQQDKRARLATLEGELGQDQDQLAGHLARLGADSIEAAEEKLLAYKQIAQERANGESVLGAVRAGASDDEIRDQWNKVRLDVFGIDQELRNPDVAGRRLTALEFQSLEVEVNRLDQERQRLERMEQRLTWELERLSQEAESLAEVEEQWQEAQDALAIARKQHAVFAAALEGLDEARKQAEVPVREVVAGTASQYLKILSGDRYERLVVEKDSLEVKVWSEDAGEWVTPAEPYLSRGTVDQVYLSARLALVTVLAAGKRPPLLLDDPFVTFDETRRDAAARLLKELSREHQIFLFTCTHHFDTDADRVIELPAPTSRIQIHLAESPTAEPAEHPESQVPSVGPLWEHLRRS